MVNKESNVIQARPYSSVKIVCRTEVVSSELALRENSFPRQNVLKHYMEIFPFQLHTILLYLHVARKPVPFRATRIISSNAKAYCITEKIHFCSSFENPGSVYEQSGVSSVGSHRDVMPLVHVENNL